jgi:hypothetical protein
LTEIGITSRPRKVQLLSGWSAALVFGLAFDAVPMRCLKTWQKSATFMQRTQGGAGSLPPNVAEKLHAPVREVCI